MSEWKEYRLGELVEIITGYPFKGDQYEFTGKLKVVRGENVTIGALRWDSEKFWNKSISGLEKYLLEKDDIVIGMDGSRVGHNRSIIKEVSLPLILAQRVARLRAKKGIDQKFIWYIIYSESFKDYVEAIHTGTSIPHISQKQIEEYVTSIPVKIHEQQSIAAVLSSLDNKIDLLHRQNATLEALAETLFTSFFSEDTNLTELGNVVQTTSGGTPSRANPLFYENGVTPWVKSKELNNSFLFDTEEKITAEAIKMSSAKILPTNSVLIAMYGATVGEYGVIAKEMACNQAICALIPNKEYPYTFLFLFVKQSKENLINSAVGSAQQNISQILIKRLSIPADADKIKKFHELAISFFEKIRTNQSQILTLTTLRDTLLPKLMSGEIRVG